MEKVRTTREYDGKVQVHIREARCPYCGKLNWLVEEMRPWCHDYCEHLQKGYSTYEMFAFEEKQKSKEVVKC